MSQRDELRAAALTPFGILHEAARASRARFSWKNHDALHSREKKHTMNLRLLRSLTLFFVVLSAMFSAAQDTLVILVRHADRASEDRDSPLSAQGQRRAACLARTLADAHLDKIYVTEFQRTQQTAAPAASAARVDATRLKAADVTGTVAMLRALPAGTHALVVGHGDTVPAIVTGLGGEATPIGSKEFDRMYVLAMNAGAVRAETLVHYCADLGEGAPATMQAAPAPK